jgi:hypothetical protein
MPKEGAMMQLSRPFQIVLVTFCLFAAVWFFALRSHSASTSGGGSSPPSAASPAAQPATPSTPYHGSAPGVAGLTRAIEKAHGAVTQSEQHAKRLQQKSAEASGERSGGTAPHTSKAGAGAAHAVTPKAPPKAAAPATTSVTPKSSATTHGSAATGGGAQAKTGAASKQATIEAELKRGNVVVLLFWDPRGADDKAVHSELQLLQAVHHGLRPLRNVPVVRRLLKAAGMELSSKIAVHDASASQVASFGSFTRTAQVYSTPTVMIINPRGQATTLTGLTDAFSLEQAIDTARHN